MSLINLTQIETEDGQNADSRRSKIYESEQMEEYEYNTTVHYLSPVSLTMTALNEEDRVQSLSTTAFYQYLDQQQQYEYNYEGEISDIYSLPYYSQSSILSEEELQLERTLAIIKPDAVYYKDVVIRKIRQEGFKILQKRKIHLTPEQVSELYCQYYGDISFPYLVVSMSSGPVIAMILACTNAVAKWKNLIKYSGSINSSWFFPKSMRLKFGITPTLDSVLHASEDVHIAKKEIRFFFPKQILEPLFTQENATDYLEIKVNRTLISALTELCKKKPLEPFIFFAEWLLLNNPYQPKTIPEIAKLPT